MKGQKEHPQRNNLVGNFLIRVLRLRMHTSCLEADKLVQKKKNLSNKFLLFKTTSKKRQKSDLEDRELLRMHHELIMLIQAIQFRIVQRPG